jgi:hypothetical protein
MIGQTHLDRRREMLITGKGRKYAFYFVASIMATVIAQGESAHRVKVIFLRQESALHTSLENRDVYLVSVRPKKGTDFVARVVDQYPGYADTPHVSSANSEMLLSVTLRRAPYCDGAPTGPNDEGTVRCFEAVHGSWRLPKHGIEEQWWK